MYRIIHIGIGTGIDIGKFVDIRVGKGKGVDIGKVFLLSFKPM